MSRVRAVVALMTRYPRAGAVKTRLIPALGAQGAADLHRDLAALCVARLRPLQAAGEASVEVHCDGGSAAEVRRWLGRWPRLVAQPDGDLGERLRAALSCSIAAGAPAAVVVGSDCPSARAEHVRAALRSLATNDAVVGPAEDGGYWLLGVTADAAPRALAVLFDGVGWGGDDVFARTLELARGAGLRVALAERLADVDRSEDLEHWRAEIALVRSAPLTVSVVIPALDEEGRIGSAVRSALDGGALEVIVVDGGSRDATRENAEAAGARVIGARPGRASQMNAGAGEAVGDALVFLHADTRLPPGFSRLVCEALADRGTSGGAFTWGTDDAPWSSFFSWMGRARVALSGFPYGDQALFMRRRDFEDLGGYPEQPVMEDWELARRLRRLGRLRILPERVVTSSRRWAEAGVIRASAAYLAIIGGYRLGIDPVRLEGWRRP